MFNDTRMKKNKNTGHKNLELQFTSDRKEDFQSIDYWEYCDNCGEKLVARKCEFICEKCGFFHSCSEP